MTFFILHEFFANFKVQNEKCHYYVFHENIRKYIQILLKFHFETIEPSIGFIVNQVQNFKTLE